MRTLRKPVLLVQRVYKKIRFLKWQYCAVDEDKKKPRRSIPLISLFKLKVRETRLLKEQQKQAAADLSQAASHECCTDHTEGVVYFEKDSFPL